MSEHPPIPPNSSHFREFQDGWCFEFGVCGIRNYLSKVPTFLRPIIAAVAEVEMVSRLAGAEAAAYLRLRPEAPPEGGSRGAPVGTSVSVRRLFARQPARRKFLRSPGSESSAVSGVVSHYALAYPEVRFSLSLDGRQGLSTSGSGRASTIAILPSRVGKMLSCNSVKSACSPSFTLLRAVTMLSRRTSS